MYRVQYTPTVEGFATISAAAILFAEKTCVPVDTLKQAVLQLRTSILNRLHINCNAKNM